MEDKTLACVDCQDSFTWTAGEQKFYEEQRFTQPKRCKPCRKANKDRKGDRKY
jgi:hypothetical protein